MQKNKKRLILHIGTPKTGSSALQVFLLENAMQLEKEGILYPSLNESFVDKKDYFELSVGNAGILACPPTPTAPWTFDATAITKLLNMGAVDKILLLSSELIWLIKDKKAFIQCILDADFEVDVVVYLRRHDEYLNSAISQNIKDGNPSWKVILNDFSDDAPLNFNYYKELEKISSVIGREHVIVRAYEKEQLVDGSIVSDFMSILGIPLDERFHIPPVRINFKASPNYLKLMDVCSTLPISFMEIKRTFLSPVLRLSTLLEKNAPETYFMSIQERKEFMQRYEDSTRSVARDYLHRENGQLFYDTEIKDDGVYFSDAAYTMDDAVRLLGYVACHQTQSNKQIENSLETLSVKCDQKLIEIESEINLQQRQLAVAQQQLASTQQQLAAAQQQLAAIHQQLNGMCPQFTQAQQTIDFLLKGRVAPWKLIAFMARWRQKREEKKSF